MYYVQCKYVYYVLCTMYICICTMYNVHMYKGDNGFREKIKNLSLPRASLDLHGKIEMF